MKLKISAILLLMIALLVTVIACGGDLSGGKDPEITTKAHEHKYGEWTTILEPTCITPGEKTRVCDCGHKELEEIATVGHKEVTTASVEATCTKDGSTEGKHCSVCNKILTEATVIPAKGHTEVADPEVAATCTTDGKTAGSHCSVCSEVLVPQSTIAAKGHDYSSPTVISEASCVQDGEKKFSCKNCSHSYTESYSLRKYSATEIFEQSSKYVGEISVYDKGGSYMGVATGFVIDSNGVVVTNFHVVEGAYYATFTIGSKTYNVTHVLGYDVDIDIAVLKINATGLTPAYCCNKPLKTGETVYAIGSSKGLTNTYSQGIITYAARVIDGVTYVQHDASITNGNSGGPLINVYGEVIGVNTWGLADSQNLNFAVFVGEFKNVALLDSPITLSQLQSLVMTPRDKVINWLMSNYNYNENGIISYDAEQDESGTYMMASLCYDTERDYLSLFFYCITETGGKISFNYYLDGDCDYYASAEISGNRNETTGYVDPSTYTVNTTLSYETYEGLESNMDGVMNLYRISFNTVLEFYSDLNEIGNIGVSLADFGFTSISFD